MRASADCLQIAANSASPWKKLPACALEFTGRVEIWTPTRYLEDTRFRLDEPPSCSQYLRRTENLCCGDAFRSKPLESCFVEAFGRILASLPHVYT